MSEAQIKQTEGGFLLTGASGLVGRALIEELGHRGVRVLKAVRTRVALARSSADRIDRLDLAWNPESPQPFADPGALEGLDVVVHLSGANLAARRWTAAYKQEIVSSRTETTAALVRTLGSLRRPPRLLIAASATGIYGDRGDEVLTEASGLGPPSNFLSDICRQWEAASAPIAGIRVVHLRLGVVLDPRGGALAKVLPLFRAGLGGRLGSGRQWMSWIAIDDLVQAVMHIAGLGTGWATATRLPVVGSTAAARTVEELAGPVNCVSPAPVSNADYTQALASVLHRPALATAPAFALRLALGEMADAALLSSCRALPQKLLDTGFVFRFPEIESALTHLLGA
jgi:uncharacterized protein (TIGR01777 family)